MLTAKANSLVRPVVKELSPEQYLIGRSIKLEKNGVVTMRTPSQRVPRDMHMTCARALNAYTPEIMSYGACYSKYIKEWLNPQAVTIYYNEGSLSA